MSAVFEPGVFEVGVFEAATTFDNLVQSVYTVTKRRDLVAETQLAIIRAIKKEHAAYDYPDDLLIVGPVTLTPNSPDNYRYSVPLSSGGANVYPNARKIKYIREILGTINQSLYTWAGYYGELVFDELAIDNIFDNYNTEVSTYYTRIGQTVNIIAPRSVAQVAIAYYNTPNMSVPANYGVTYTDWLADEWDYVIWEHAAAEIFRIIGKDSEFKTFESKIQDNRRDLVMSKIGAI